MERRKTRQVSVGALLIGGDAPVSVQTMARAETEDMEACLREIAAAGRAGCDVVRLAVASPVQARAFGRVAARASLPLVADTHFDWRTTVAAIREGAAKVRINPGNMDPEALERVVDAAGEKGIPIRIGGNSGSILHRRPPAEQAPGESLGLEEIMAEELLAWAARMEGMGFRDIVLSVKTHDAAGTVRANRLLAERSDYPLHLGVTAAGPRQDALLKTSAALGALLLDGIGDTLRFSFTGDMPGEVEAGIAFLRALDLRRDRPEIISCPGCGRCRIDLARLVGEVREGLAHLTGPLKVAVMGCEVNGPGEARAADLGIASAGGIIHLFRNGRVVERIPAERAVARLLAEAKMLLEKSREKEAYVAP